MKHPGLRVLLSSFLFFLVAANMFSEENVWDERNQRIQTKLKRNHEVIDPYMKLMDSRIESMNEKVINLREDVVKMRKERQYMQRRASKPRR